MRLRRMLVLRRPAAERPLARSGLLPVNHVDERNETFCLPARHLGRQANGAFEMTSAVRNKQFNPGGVEDAVRLLRVILSGLRRDPPDYITPRRRAQIAAAIAIAEDIAADSTQQLNR